MKKIASLVLLTAAALVATVPVHAKKSSAKARIQKRNIKSKPRSSEDRQFVAPQKSLLKGMPEGFEMEKPSKGIMALNIIGAIVAFVLGGIVGRKTCVALRADSGCCHGPGCCKSFGACLLSFVTSIITIMAVMIIMGLLVEMGRQKKPAPKRKKTAKTAKQRSGKKKRP